MREQTGLLPIYPNAHNENEFRFGKSRSTRVSRCRMICAEVLDCTGSPRDEGDRQVTRAALLEMWPRRKAREIHRNMYRRVHSGSFREQDTTYRVHRR